MDAESDSENSKSRRVIVSTAAKLSRKRCDAMGVMFFFRRSDVFLNIVSHVSELEASAKVMAVCPYRSTLAIICELLPRLLPCDDLEPRLAIND